IKRGPDTSLAGDASHGRLLLALLRSRREHDQCQLAVELRAPPWATRSRATARETTITSALAQQKHSGPHLRPAVQGRGPEHRMAKKRKNFIAEAVPKFHGASSRRRHSVRACLAHCGLG